MVIIRRKLCGLVRYTTAFFPEESAIDEIVARLRPFELARLFYTPVLREPGSHIIAREASKTVCVDLCKPTEALWNALHRRCRQKLGHVERLSHRVSIKRNGLQTTRDFLMVFNGFAHAKEHVSAINARILDRHAPYADVFVIYLDGRPMCAHSVMRDEQTARARLLFLGSRRLEDHEAAAMCGDLNRFLHWHEIQVYRDEGFRVFDFGGISNDPHNGIARFKRSFGGAVVSEHSYLCAGARVIGRIAQSLRERLRPNPDASPALDPAQDLRDEYPATS